MADTAVSRRHRDTAGFAARIDGGRLSLRAPGLFDGDDRAARQVIDHAFSLDEVRSVVVRRDRASIVVELTPHADPHKVFRQLGALLKTAAGSGLGRAARLDLAPGLSLPIRIARAGGALTTFRTRIVSPDSLRIGHPLLRRREVRLRFQDWLRSLHGVADVRRSGFGAAASVVFDGALIEAEQILRLLESAWPEIVAGEAEPTNRTRLAVASGLLGVSFAAQFFVPALLPWATAAVVVYSLPNFIAAIRDLARGRVGLPALYSAGLGFLLWTRMPFASSLMSTFRQLWPELANQLASTSEARLFSAHRRRIAWARVRDDRGAERIVGADELATGDIMLVRTGEYVPADGIVREGEAAVDEELLTGQRGAAHKIAGDPVHAGTLVRDGALTLQATRVRGATSSAALARALPQGALRGLPSLAQVERIGDRNARPALAAAAMLLLATRTIRLSQVVLRPDYTTAPRLSAHLSALTAMAQSLADGALVRRPAALDMLPSVEVFAFDDGAILGSRAVEVHKINVVARSAAAQTLAFAAAALEGLHDPRRAALEGELETHEGETSAANGRRQRAGEIVYWSEAGARIAVSSPARALAQSYTLPTPALSNLVRKLASHPVADPAQRPLVVARDGRVLGVVQFARSGPPRLADFVARLRGEQPEARIVHLSSSPQDSAEAAVEGLGFDAVFAGLDVQEKAEALRSLGLPVAWIGAGADAASAPARLASAVSISLSGFASLPEDEADIVLLRDDLDVLLNLRHAAAAHARRLQGDYRWVYFANLMAVAGGFTAGLGSLEAGLVSNLGSAAVFLKRWRTLATLAPARLAPPTKSRA